MTPAKQPVLVLIGGGLNILSGLFNMFFGLLWTLMCIGIVPLAIGVWQVSTGVMSLTGGGRRVPSNFVAACCGVLASIMTFNILGAMVCFAAAVLLGIEVATEENQARQGAGAPIDVVAVPTAPAASTTEPSEAGALPVASTDSAPAESSGPETPSSAAPSGPPPVPSALAESSLPPTDNPLAAEGVLDLDPEDSSEA